MLYTRNGDDGLTKLFGAQERISKSSAIIELLGSLDSLVSFIGLCKVKIELHNVSTRLATKNELENLQHDLFTVQAYIAGAPQNLAQNATQNLEQWIDTLEKELPSITHFTLPGGTELSALFDIARTMARHAERSLVTAQELGEIPTNQAVKTYLNRLSSLFFVLARLANHQAGIKEVAPQYR